MYDYNHKPDLNITPLVDIMLVLVAILMVTFPTIEYSEKISLPMGSKTQNVEQIDKIEIQIFANELILFQNKKETFSSFADSFSLIAPSLNKGAPVLIRADKNLKYNFVMSTLKIVRQSGFAKVMLATNGQ